MFVASLIGLVAGLSAVHAQAPPLATELGPVNRPPATQIYRGPLDFYVATGPADACGPGCREWIAADGNFDQGAGARFKEFLSVPRRRNLPIFIHSQGGFLTAAVEVARLLNDYRMTAGVGRTTPTGCTPMRLPGGVCDQRIKSGEDVPSTLEFDRGQCHSACVFAFLGATQRKIADGALLGVHASHSDEMLWKEYLDKNPGAMRMSVEQRNLTTWRLMMAYGVDPELSNVAAKIDPKKILVLSREELIRYGVITQDQFETPWRPNPDLATRVRLFKLVNVTGESKVNINRTVTVALSCNTDQDLILSYQRKVSTYEPATTLKVVLNGAGGFGRTMEGRIVGTGGVWATAVGYDDLRRAAQGGPILVTETYPNGTPLTANISSAGIAPALAELQKDCNERNISAATTGGNAD